MNRDNLQLDISLGQSGGMDWQSNGEGSTYKDEGLSVGMDHMVRAPFPLFHDFLLNHICLP